MSVIEAGLAGEGTSLALRGRALAALPATAIGSVGENGLGPLGKYLSPPRVNEQAADSEGCRCR